MSGFYRTSVLGGSDRISEMKSFFLPNTFLRTKKKSFSCVPERHDHLTGVTHMTAHDLRTAREEHRVISVLARV